MTRRQAKWNLVNLHRNLLLSQLNHRHKPSKYFGLDIGSFFVHHIKIYIEQPPFMKKQEQCLYTDDKLGGLPLGQGGLSGKIGVKDWLHDGPSARPDQVLYCNVWSNT